jgi:hypothetical protein
LFSRIKVAIMQAPTLMSVDYTKGFILYTFASDTSYATVLTQKNEEGEEFRVAFMSLGLLKAKLKYPKVDKHAFALFKVVKHFKP